MIGINLPKEIDVKVDLAELSEALQKSPSEIRRSFFLGIFFRNFKNMSFR